VIITTRNLLQYLLAKDLVTSETVVDGDFAVIDVSGRNRNFKVIRKHNASLFVKQVRNLNEQSIAMLQCEAACYWLSLNEKDFAALAPMMPPFFSYDLERHVLITGLITKGENLWQHFRRLQKVSPVVAGELGRLLGTYHHDGGDRLKDSPQAAIFPKQIPWILSPERRNSHPFKELSKATSQLFDHVEGSPELCIALDQLRDNWVPTTLMHGDMRFENCILSISNVESQFNFKIVDWELADMGDPCWDIGSIIQAFISARIISLRAVEASLSLKQFLTEQAPSWLKDALVLFCQEYLAALRVETKRSNELLERCISYGAARMIQSAYEYMQFSPHLSTNALHLLEVSSDILKDPTVAARQLFQLDR
jgi:hypothetical protein